MQMLLVPEFLIFFVLPATDSLWHPVQNKVKIMG